LFWLADEIDNLRFFSYLCSVFQHLFLMLDELKANVSRLIALYERERERADSLSGLLSEKEAEAGRYREEVKKCKEQIADLTLQIDNLRLAAAIGSQPDRKKAHESIDRLIKEIDDCIKLLEN